LPLVVLPALNRFFDVDKADRSDSDEVLEASPVSGKERLRQSTT